MEISEREKIERRIHSQNTFLRLSPEEVGIEEILEKALGMIFSIPAFAFDCLYGQSIQFYPRK